MSTFCDNRISKTSEIKSKKKSIKRHNKLVRKEIAIKMLRRRHSGGVKGRRVYSNNFLSGFKRAFGDDVVQLEYVIVRELKAEVAMEKPADSVRYVLPQYTFKENEI